MTAIIVFAPLDCLGVRLYAADGAFAYSKLAGILQLAIEHNAIISAARERVEQSRADVRISGARMAPSVTGGVGAAWNDASQGASRNVYNASLNLSQTIFAGGSLVANKRAADLELSAVKAEGVRTYQGVLNSARSNYYDCLRAYARMHVAEESLNLSKEHLKQAEALYKAGMVPRGDVLRVKTSVSQGDLDRIDAENDLNVSWTALERVAGMNISMGDVLEPLSGDAISELTPPEFDLSGDIVQRALSQRPEIKAYESYSERAKQLVKSASGQRLPNIVLSGQLGITDDSFWPTDEDTWRVQIQLQWTLFDSGEISAQVKKAKASAQELLYQLEDLASQIRQEVVQSEFNLSAATTRLAVAGEQVATAEEDYRIAVRRYNAQMGTNLDVLDAAVALTNIRNQYVNAVYDIAVAQAGLIYAAGEDLPQKELFEIGDRQLK